MSGNNTFSRSVFKTLILFVGGSLALVIGSLYLFLTTSLEERFHHKLQVEAVEVSNILSDRLQQLEDRAKELGYSNSIRVNLMLSLHGQLDELIKDRFPAEKGAYYFVKDSETGLIIPEQPDKIQHLLEGYNGIDQKIKEQKVTFHLDGAGQVWAIFTLPLKRKAHDIGWAYVAYNLVEDSSLRERLYTKSSERLLYARDTTVIDLLTGEHVLQPDISVDGGQEALVRLFPKKEILFLAHFPDIRLVASKTSLNNEKKSLLVLLVVLCSIIFLLTTVVSAFIARMVSSPLEKMADNALKIGENPTELDFEGGQLRHVEFVKLADAFNKVLVRLGESQKTLSARADELDKSERQYRLLAENSREIIISFNLSRQVTYINQQGLKIGGYTREDIGKVTIDYLLQLNDSNNGGYIETHFFLKNGGTINVEAQISPLVQDGCVEGWLATIRDVTEKNRLENQLQQAKKIEALGVLAGGIAHDFNNILYTIYGCTEMALDELTENSLVYEDLKVVIKSADRASELVQQILTFSRQTETEQQVLQIQPVVMEALKLLRASIPANIEIVQKIDKASHHIIANPTQVHQVVMNLCANSAHAMEEKGGCITIEIKKVPYGDGYMFPNLNTQSNDWLLMSVADDGIGISESQLGQIFDPYFTTKPQGKGTGLGLATVHGIVKSMEGEIDVESTVDKGTTVRLFFPIVEDDTRVHEEDTLHDIVSGSERILLVDDDLYILRMVKKMLNRLGYEVIACEGSLEALELFQKNVDRVDLVVSDMQMPNMTGLELAKELKKIKQELPIIICTGYSSVLEDANTEGICEILRKPLARQVLAEAINRRLNIRGKQE